MVLQRFALTPGTLSQNLVQVQSHCLSGNQAFYFSFQFVGQNSHQGLGGEPVLGSLFVITLGHVFEHIVSGQIDIVNDLAQVGFEVSGGQVVQVVQGILRNFSLPLEFTFAVITDGPQGGISIHPGYKSILQL
jgi:hypothetical protein